MILFTHFDQISYENIAWNTFVSPYLDFFYRLLCKYWLWLKFVNHIIRNHVCYKLFAHWWIALPWIESIKVWNLACRYLHLFCLNLSTVKSFCVLSEYKLVILFYLCKCIVLYFFDLTLISIEFKSPYHLFLFYQFNLRYLLHGIWSLKY